MLVVSAPGQGAQTPGFLEPWLDVQGVEDRLAAFSDVAGMDLVAHGTTSDAETIRDTAVAQPLLVAAGLVTLRALDTSDVVTEESVDLTAGHSVGEITAAAIAGVLSGEQAMSLVAERGRAMADAAARTPTGMTAVLGGKPDTIAAALAEHGLTAANMNGPGQVVAAGTVEQLAALAADPPARTMLRPLSVAGAFHTEHMASAVGRLDALAAGLDVAEPRTRLLSNRDGALVTTGRDMLDRLVGQVSAPVRWDLCMATMLDLGITGLLELAPAGTLTGLAKRGLKGVATFALNTPDQIDEARAFVSQHSDTTAGGTT